MLAELTAALDLTYVRTHGAAAPQGEGADERRIIKAHLMEVGDKLAALERIDDYYSVSSAACDSALIRT